ncbi:hypothetical protein DMC30DRAFT_173938 [Rhodotorula diobovata]|uniref:MYST-type HAT domain-containing protein n=1 Tax=Rhodotorula diobovata TaxID=5288 RepID=A0A5C5FYZ0_9BASI|nr:hypothetical protein DMC30DRAFT_173938 [Rhodotorula diobovata]
MENSTTVTAPARPDPAAPTRATTSTNTAPSSASDRSTLSATAKGKKRAREVDNKLSPGPSSTHSRRIDRIVYAGYEVQAQYGSPYPLDELPGANAAAAEKAAPGAVARDGRVHIRDAGGKFGKKVKKVEVTATGGPGRSSAAKSQPEGASGAAVGANAAASTSGARLPSPELGAAEPTWPVAADNGAMPLASEEHGPLGNATSAESPHPAHAPSEFATTVPPNPSLELAPSSQLPEAAPPAALSSSVPPNSLSPAALLSPAAPAPTAAPHQLQPSASASSPNVRADRGKGGRFVPKPPGESVKSKRAAERAARASQLAQASTNGAPHLTQRQQREIARKAREEREREAASELAERGGSEEVRLLVCEKCFKYMTLPAVFAAHTECDVKQPPGRRVYQRGATSIWEVDGATAKLYCQNLCLFAKLFIEHKYMFFDVDGFTFYLLTETMAKQEWVLGYFSKEKVSYDDNNLACIVVFPPFRQKGWATLLIEFSYELSRRLSPSPGSPERPLSDLGQKGYLAHWIAVLVRYFRAIFSLRGEPPSIDTLLAAAHESTRSPSKGAGNDDDDHTERERRKRARRSKGWDGELPPGAVTLAGSPAKAFTLRGGSARPRSGVIDPDDGSFAFPTTLEELARAVNLRADDVAFALVESGLATYRRGGRDEVKLEEEEADEGEREETAAGEARDLELVITPELVEEVALRKGVKPMPMLDVAYVCNI